MGVKEHPLYSRWRFIVTITTNPESIDYQRYAGGHGIENRFVDFDHFCHYVETKLGPPPLGKSSLLHRKNLKGHFKPGNLMWSTQKEITHKQTRTFILKHKGTEYTYQEWARESGISYWTLMWRKHHGWTMKEIMFGKKNYAKT
jgi:hypothetical protein